MNRLNQSIFIMSLAIILLSHLLMNICIFWHVVGYKCGVYVNKLSIIILLR